MKPARMLGAVVITLTGTVIGLLLVEGLVRAFFDEPVQPRFVTDPGYGVRWNSPMTHTRHYVPGDYDVLITTNSTGMRGPREYPIARSPNTRRVVLLGDSFTVGFGVEDDEVVSAVIEDLLNANQPPVLTEVINLGVSGFGQAEELVTWQERGLGYRPDVVVIFYFDNDIGNNMVSELFTLQTDGTLSRQNHEYLPGSRLQEQMNEFAPTRWLFANSEAWNLVRNRLSQLVQNARLRKQNLTGYSDATPEGTALTRALLVELTREVSAAGAHTIFVIIPTKKLQSNFPFTPEEVAGLSATLIDGRQFLLLDDYYSIDDHWRPSGHRKAAQRIAEAIDR